MELRYRYIIWTEIIFNKFNVSNELFIISLARFSSETNGRKNE